MKEQYFYEQEKHIVGKYILAVSHGPFDLMPDQKNNADKLPRWFSVMLVPKLLLTPIKIRIFGPKTAKFGPKSAFLVILGQILPFFAPFVQFLTKKLYEQGA